MFCFRSLDKQDCIAILAEGAIALSVTLSGGVLFASWKLLQFPSSLIVKVILAIFMGASAQQLATELASADACTCALLPGVGGSVGCAVVIMSLRLWTLAHACCSQVWAAVSVMHVVIMTRLIHPFHVWRAASKKHLMYAHEQSWIYNGNVYACLSIILDQDHFYSDF